MISKKYVVLTALLLVLPFSVGAESIEMRAGAKADFQPEREAQTQRRAALEERVDAMKERMEVMRDRAASTTAVVRERITENRAERIKAHAERIYEVLSTSLTRLDSFSGKVETRLDELEARGIDVSSSRTKLAEADEALATAKANIEDLQVTLSTELSSDTTTRADVLALVRAARQELAQVRVAYAQVFMQVRVDVNAGKEE